MAAAQVMAAPVHDNNNCSKEEKNRDITQDMPFTEAEEQAPDAKVRDNGDSMDEEVTIAVDTDEGRGLAQEVEAKLAVEPAEGGLKETKEGRPRPAKKTEKAAAKGAVVPVDDHTADEAAEPKGAKKAEKAAAKWAVVPVDDDTEDEAAAPADQAPGPAPIAHEEAAEAACEEAIKGGTKCEKAHEE
ncbi:hypothetical protein CFC21_110468 [Triticum aestivum]|uniref:Uncharacterized protein n=3 Tax=Triticinae TaxID=1648030 RepID=A0A453SLG3_AEGTS|nr:uncharacterized protein LOC109771135 isoform X2 [Aegilops tauschii subsp. strangulata]XP_044444008.1 uncharacterized protein LOC123170243 isoform X2 [Triticum aestivum]KAF7110343.1 hypothetical protein CFC21_110468 [Triticum aestivum]